jgi:radical SAM superfamily enzyme YgiQ (UPF0313 family)
MKILFSNPPWWESDAQGRTLRQGIRAGSRWPFTRPAAHAPDAFRFGGYIPAPFFLQYAASYTARALAGSHVVLRDSIARGESYNTYAEHLADERYDFIVIESATSSWAHDGHLIERIAALSPESKVILTGTLGKEKAHEIFHAHRNVIAIIEGEYDKRVASAITQYLAARKHVVDVPPRVLHHDLLTVDEMNAAPLPMWDDACALNYWDGCPVGHQPPQLQIWTSRGCPFKCCFCVWPATMTGNDPDGTKPRAVRCYSPEYMAALLEERLAWAASRGTPYRSIYLDDDTMNLVNKHTIAMCGVMKKTGLPWSAMCRADTSTREVWQLMKDSGCFGVKIGFESGSQRVIDKIINKRLDLKKAEETAKYLRSIGLTVHGTFTVGLPGETPEESQQTTEFIARLMREGTLNTYQLSGTATIEGTPLAAIAAGGHLEKYPDATNEGFVVSPDGQKKIEALAQR